ncbi:alpha/beta hydrolase family protein [Nocardia thailandica]
MRIDTGAGPAEVALDGPARPAFLLLMTHGAGGSCDTKDIAAVCDSAIEHGGVAARVTQPYRVAGRRAPGSAPAQDAAWLEIVGALRRRYPDTPLVQGGRSNGARVACRTAVEAGARGVVALSFPLHPPGKPEKSRREELLATGDIPVVVINGGSDPFGVPDAADAAELLVIPRQPHSFRTGFEQMTATVGPWFERWRD